MTYAQMDGYLIPDLVLAEQEGQQIGKYRCRISGCHGVIRHILCHDRTGCHDGVLTDCHAGKDRGIRSDPRAAFDADRFAEQYLPVVGIVVVGDQRNIRCDQWQTNRPRLLLFQAGILSIIRRTKQGGSGG